MPWRSGATAAKQADVLACWDASSLARLGGRGEERLRTLDG